MIVTQKRSGVNALILYLIIHVINAFTSEGLYQSCDAMYIIKYYFKSPTLFVFFQYSRRDAFKCIVNIDCIKLDCDGVSRGNNGLRRGPAGLNRSWTFDPCTPCLKICTPTFKILPNTLGVGGPIYARGKHSRTARSALNLVRHYIVTSYVAGLNIAWCEELNGSMGYNLVASSFRHSFGLRGTLMFLWGTDRWHQASARVSR